jgi:hypothetical protein
MKYKQLVLKDRLSASMKRKRSKKKALVKQVCLKLGNTVYRFLRYNKTHPCPHCFKEYKGKGWVKRHVNNGKCAAFKRLKETQQPEEEEVGEGEEKPVSEKSRCCVM